jgi:hypothetical protein
MKLEGTIHRNSNQLILHTATGDYAIPKSEARRLGLWWLYRQGDLIGREAVAELGEGNRKGLSGVVKQGTLTLSHSLCSRHKVLED